MIVKEYTLAGYWIDIPNVLLNYNTEHWLTGLQGIDLSCQRVIRDETDIDDLLSFVCFFFVIRPFPTFLYRNMSQN